MTVQELTEKYKLIPNELKTMKRWVCFRVETLTDQPNKTTKRPYNAITGKLARVNDEMTWSSFNIAINGCFKYQMHGIGFVLGNGIFGIDLDNHINDDGTLDYPENEFDNLCNEFINQLNSYTEYSQSGNGIHIICEGKLPEGRRRKKGVETYDTNRFFAFTGNVIKNVPIKNCENEIIPLWDKYVADKLQQEIEPQKTYINTNREIITLNDQEIIDTILNSKQGGEFYRYYHDGDINVNGKQNHSDADGALVCMLAFWCNGDKAQIDRIFRTSALMRDKWDEKRGANSYGEIVINNACNLIGSKGYVKYKKEEPKGYIEKNIEVDDNGEVIDSNKPLMNLDENNEPIFRIKENNYKNYTYTDTGNAERLFDYFGDLFHYNTTDKTTMFWTGKVWLADGNDSPILRKYATKLIDVLKEEAKSITKVIQDKTKEGETAEAKFYQGVLDSANKNITRISNKAGKDAMISEFKAVKSIPIKNDCFNQNDYLLNTENGIVDLRTGDIIPYDQKKLITQKTNCGVSYEEPTQWLKFLDSIFNQGEGKEKETKDIIDTLQVALGYSLTGSTKEQVLFLLYGSGSNGKSTLTEFISYILGTYSDNIRSEILMQQKNGNSTAIYTLAKLQYTRFLETGETDEGGQLAEAFVKSITGSDKISAQFKYGNEFSYSPKFKLWMSTNNKPFIRGTDDGIWRRIFEFPFINKFSKEKKDKDMPEKLRKESDKVLGWMIKGALKWQKEGLIMPECLENTIASYRKNSDVVEKFIDDECIISKNFTISTKTLYTNYCLWTKYTNEFKHKESKFKEEMVKKGYLITIIGGKQYYTGISVDKDNSKLINYNL